MCAQKIFREIKSMLFLDKTLFRYNMIFKGRSNYIIVEKIITVEKA